MMMNARRSELPLAQTNSRRSGPTLLCTRFSLLLFVLLLLAVGLLGVLLVKFSGAPAVPLSPPPAPAINDGNSNDNDNADAAAAVELAAAQRVIDLSEHVRGKVDDNHLHGTLWGVDEETGQPGWRPTPYLSVNAESEEQKRAAHAGYSFNVLRSNSLPLSRSLPDGRNPRCRSQTFPPLLSMPSVSIVIIFLNEPASTLYRTLHAILDRTPPELLHEVLLVDDGSDSPWLQQPLEAYLRLLPAKVRLLRNAKRQGLMGARTVGARQASGDVLVFLDCHVEPLPHWLEPLLVHVMADPQRVAMPIIDQIEPDSFQYQPGGIELLGFTWKLEHTHPGRSWDSSQIAPVSSPMMAGGLFAIQRERFWALGGYDPGLREWGGEELELSLKIWMCGGSLELIPCSRVAHVFRSAKYASGVGYKVDVAKVIANKLRVAEVWMDDYKDIVGQQLTTHLPLGDLSAQQQLRRGLACKSFDWYLDTVYPELFNPRRNCSALKIGELRHRPTNRCLTVSSGGHLLLAECAGHVEQSFARTSIGEYRLALGSFAECLDSGGPGARIVRYTCHRARGNQDMVEDRPFPGAISNRGHCLEAGKTEPAFVTLQRCDPNNSYQLWGHHYQQPIK